MKNILKWGSIGLGGLIGLIAVFVLIVVVSTNGRINRDYSDVAIEPLDAELVANADLAEGERLFSTQGCIDCHGTNGGGAVLVDEAPLGTFAGSNLTSGEGGVAANYANPEEWAHAIRHGIKPNGEAILVMPSSEYAHLTDVDVAAMVAYMQSLEPVDNVTPENRLGPVFRMLLFTNQEAFIQAEIIDHDNIQRVAEVDRTTVNMELGEYLAASCVGCHGDNYAGGPLPGAGPDDLPSANITPHPDGIGEWTAEEFITAMQTGVRPDGSQIDESMPWPAYSQLSAIELESLFNYLQTLEPVASGS